MNEPVTIVASSPFVRDNRVISPMHRAIIPPFSASKSQETLIAWFQNLLDETKPEKLYIDAFPGGILGELNRLVLPPGCECYLLARIIKWPEYLDRIPDFRLHFRKVHILEKIDPHYQEFLQRHADEISFTRLGSLPSQKAPIEIPDNAWLVIHSGPDSELQALLARVEQDMMLEKQQPEIVVIYPGRRPAFVRDEFVFAGIYPAYSLFERAARVYSAAGFNMVHQMCSWRHKHYVMPFARLIDDQFARVSLYHDEFAAVLTEKHG
jgi:hypothetical protein